MGVDANSMIAIASIAINGTLSTEIAIPAGMAICGIEVPSDWTAANITFQAKTTGGTLYNVYDEDGAEVVVTAAASRYIAFQNLNPMMGLRHIKVRSGTQATPVTQLTSIKNIRLLLRKV